MPADVVAKRLSTEVAVIVTAGVPLADGDEAEIIGGVGAVRSIANAVAIAATGNAGTESVLAAAEGPVGGARNDTEAEDGAEPAYCK